MVAGDQGASSLLLSVRPSPIARTHCPQLRRPSIRNLECSTLESTLFFGLLDDDPLTLHFLFISTSYPDCSAIPTSIRSSRIRRFRTTVSFAFLSFGRIRPPHNVLDLHSTLTTLESRCRCLSSENDREGPVFRANSRNRRSDSHGWIRLHPPFYRTLLYLDTTLSLACPWPRSFCGKNRLFETKTSALTLSSKSAQRDPRFLLVSFCVGCQSIEGGPFEGTSHSRSPPFPFPFDQITHSNLASAGKFRTLFSRLRML